MKKATRKPTDRRSFTRTFIDNAACPKGRRQVFFYDTKTAALALCVTQTGSKVFYLYRRIHGRPERVRLGRWPEVSVADARRKAAIVNAQIAEGGDPKTAHRTARGEITFEELFAMFIEGHAKLRKRTWRDDQDQFARYLSAWAGLKLSRIRKADVIALHNRLGQKHPYAANRLLALVRVVFNKADELAGWKGANPAAGIRKFPEKSRDRFLNADELPAFFQSLAKEIDTFRTFFTLALLTGARRANVQAMKWDEISLERGVWRIPDTKTGEPVTVPLCPVARAMLQERKAKADSQCPWVFPSRGKSGHLMEPKAAWRRVLDRAGLKNLRIHDLRRTLGSWQAATGASLPVIGKTLGHKQQETTAIYARLSIDPVRAAVNVAADAMLAAAGQTEAPQLPASSTGSES